MPPVPLRTISILSAVQPPGVMLLLSDKEGNNRSVQLRHTAQRTWTIIHLSALWNIYALRVTAFIGIRISLFSYIAQLMHLICCIRIPHHNTGYTIGFYNEEQVDLGIINIFKIPGTEYMADVLTKSNFNEKDFESKTDSILGKRPNDTLAVTLYLYSCLYCLYIPDTCRG
eukprot:gene29573-39206_t